MLSTVEADMVGRLWRALVGSTHREPLGGARRDGPAQGTRPLDAFDGSTPHRFRTWLANPADRARLPDALSAPHVRGVDVAMMEEPDGRVALEVVTLAGPRARRILEPLDTLHASDIDVRGFEPLDVATEVDDEELRRTVDGRNAEVQGQNTYARRLEALAGEKLLASSLEEWNQVAERPRRRFLSSAWRDAAVGAAFNTPGGEVALVMKARAITDDYDRSAFIEGAFRRIRLCARVGLPFEFPEAMLLRLVRGRGMTASAAIQGLEHLPGPLPDRVIDALCATASRGTGNAVYAVVALRRVPASAAVRAAVEAALDAKDPDVQEMALQTLVILTGTEARPAWTAFLDSRSALRRLAAEVVIGRYGDATDVPRAAAELRRLIRTKPATETTPPRASNFIELLVRHRDAPEAAAGLADLSARWVRLTPGLRRWIETKHPSLAPSDSTERLPAASPAKVPSVDVELLQEAPLEWPMPTIERQGDQYRLEFWEMDHAVRDRFQDLIEAEPRIIVLDGDREWLTLTVEADEPEALLAALWASANRAS